MSEMPARKGTQSIERAALILREIATRGVAGGGLWDLADRCELDRGTTHRILGALVRKRLIEQRASDRRYFLGPLVFELSVTRFFVHKRRNRDPYRSAAAAAFSGRRGCDSRGSAARGGGRYRRSQCKAPGTARTGPVSAD